MSFLRNKPTIRRLAILTLLPWVMQPAAGVESLDIRLGQLSGQGWLLQDLRLHLALDARADAIFSLSAKRLLHPALPHELSAPRLDCSRGLISDQEIRCDQGLIHLDTPLLGTPEQPFTFVWQAAERRLSISLPHLDFAGGRLALEAELQADRWHLVGSGEGLDLQQTVDRLGRLGLSLPTLELSGRAGLAFDARGDGSGIASASWDVQLDDAAFADPSGDYVGAALAGGWRGQLLRASAGFASEQSLRLETGEMLTPAFYLTADGQAIALEGSFKLAKDLDSLAVRDLRFDYPGVVAFESRGHLQLSPELKPLSFELKTLPFELGTLFTTALQPVLTGPFFEQLKLSGQVQAELSLSPQPDLKLVLAEVGIAQGEDATGTIGGNILLRGMNGKLHWAVGRESSDNHLSWHGGKLFGGIDFGPAELTLKLSENGLLLQQPASLPLLDGALQAEQFELEQTETGPRVAFRGYLTPVSMSLFSEAVGWPPLAGQVSAMIPGVSFQQDALQVDGVVLIRLFGGRILLRALHLDNLFGALPLLNASIELKDLDLETLTSTFSFGRITGKLEGRVEELRLEDWRPVAFDARFATPPGDDSRHRISQQAVDNISNLGGAGVAGAISRSFLSIFEEFGYDRLGISCRLVNGVCHMGGIAPAPSGYYLVKGGGIPRIDIIGFNHRTDWKVLIEKLQQITEGGSPVVK